MAIKFLSFQGGEHTFAEVTLASGAALKAGEVLGRLSVSGTFAPVSKSATDGTEKVWAILAHDVPARSAELRAEALVEGKVAAEHLVFSTAANTAADHVVSARDRGIIFDSNMPG